MSDDLTARYDRHALRYDRWWGPVIEPSALALFERVAEALRDGPPAHVLDVGTGTGILARAAVERWPAAEVVGLDGSDGMLGVAHSEASRRLSPEQRARVRWEPGLAEGLPFPSDGFDLVISSFVFQLVPDRLGALREAFRVLRPGGTLGYVTWLASDDDFAPQGVFDDLVDEEGLDNAEDGDDDRAGDVPSVASAGAQLRRAGFREVRAREETLEHAWTARSYARFLELYEATGVFEAVEAPARARLRRITAERLAALAPSDFAWRAPVVSALAKKPRDGDGAARSRGPGPRLAGRPAG